MRAISGKPCRGTYWAPRLQHRPLGRDRGRTANHPSAMPGIGSILHSTWTPSRPRGRNGTPRRQGFHLLVQIVLVIDRHGLSLTSHGHSRTVHTTERDTPSMRLLNHTLVYGGLRLRSRLAARPSEADPCRHPSSRARPQRRSCSGSRRTNPSRSEQHRAAGPPDSQRLQAEWNALGRVVQDPHEDLAVLKRLHEVALLFVRIGRVRQSPSEISEHDPVARPTCDELPVLEGRDAA
jgi:hypothetical protein